jgi:hypothetical protein
VNKAEKQISLGREIMSRTYPTYLDLGNKVMSEFDDIVCIGESYVTSSKAAAEMRRLAVKHGLGFMFNPGGGQFTAPGFNCQISACDDVEDLDKLRRALGK